MAIRVEYAAVGQYGTNCYLLADDASGEAAAVDCAVFDGDYRLLLQKAGVASLKYILLTHGHFDHVCGVAALKEVCGGGVCISSADAAGLTDERANLNAYVRFGAFRPAPPDRLLREGDTLFLGGTELRVMETPGHTPGSVCFLTEGMIFSGDTLFRESMGRTDLPGGSTRTLFRSLRALGELPGDAAVYPGHGPLTTLLHEKKNNFYLRQTGNFG